MLLNENTDEYLDHKFNVHFLPQLASFRAHWGSVDLNAFFHNWWTDNYTPLEDCEIEPQYLPLEHAFFDDIDNSTRFRLLARSVQALHEWRRSNPGNPALPEPIKPEPDTRDAKHHAYRDKALIALRQDFLRTTQEQDSWTNLAFNGHDFESLVLDEIKNWAKRIVPTGIDREQALAIASFHNHTKVVARAGSGKTTVMALRAVFLMDYCSVKPENLLLMAFNVKAKDELRSRICRYLLCAKGLNSPSDAALATTTTLDRLVQEHNIELPWVATFDSVARSINTANIKRDELPELIEESRQSSFIHSITREFFRDPAKQMQLRNVMLRHFLDDWHRLSDFEQSMRGSLNFSLPRETLLGQPVRSFGEKAIADWLFMNSVQYDYEATLWLESQRLSPDFTIKQAGKSLVVEYLGMQGDFRYDQNTEKKQALYRKNGITTLYLTKSDIASGSYKQKLRVALTSSLPSLKIIERSEDEIWEMKQSVASDRFHQGLKSFIERVKRSRLSATSWRAKAETSLLQDPIARDFSLLALEIYQRYEEKLRVEKRQDFIGFMIAAIEALERGASTATESGGRVRSLSGLEYICVDEYQDFSDLHQSLIQNLVRSAPSAVVFAVGDDWQSINGFMGAQPALFESFASTWDQAETKHITTNYRSATYIVDAGNAVMSRTEGRPSRPAKAEPGRLITLLTDQLEPEYKERTRFSGDQKTIGVLRLIYSHLAARPEGSVTLLSRKGSIPWFFPGKASFNNNLEDYLALVRKALPENLQKRVFISTVHSFKGLESDAIILLDALDVSFPLIHADARFMSLFGVDIAESIEEERRLFYVAVTRAKHSAYILTSTGHESRFLTDLLEIAKPSNSGWQRFPAIELDGTYIKVTGDSKPILETLKSAKFKWQPATKSWMLDITQFAEGKSLDELLKLLAGSTAPWVAACREQGCIVGLEMNGFARKVNL